MKQTLIAGRAYFGIEALLIQRGAQRAVTRTTHSSSPVVLTVEAIKEDFQVSGDAATKLIDAFVQNGILTAIPNYGGYAITERLREYAEAQLLAPLDHAAAQELLDRVLDTVAEINSRWRANPIVITRVVVSGRFTDANSKVSELKVWAIVRLRETVRSRLWRRSLSKVDGAHEIRKALRAFGPLVSVRLVIDESAVERPFKVVFDAAADSDDARESLFRRGGRWIHRRVASLNARRSELDRLCGSPAARRTS